MGEPTLAERLGAFAAGCAADGVPDEVAHSVALRVLDVLGICCAATPMATSRAAMAYAAHQGGRPEATALGVGVRLPAAQAAFVNGVLAHSLDYDDTHLPSVLHPSASVVPAALAVAQATGADGRATTAAVACGLEVCVRLGMAGYDEASGASIFFDHGQHATSICGAMGAAVAAALLYGADAEGVTHALGVAASMGAGIIEANRTGGTVKRLHCGWAAHAGISAAQLVRFGFTGPPTVLEGRFGFFEAWLHGSAWNGGAVTDGLGERWVVPDIVFKPYPANHFTHTAIDAALALRTRIADLADIEAVELLVAGPILHTLGEPLEVKRRPETGYMAQFSGPYVVAAALLGSREVPTLVVERHATTSDEAKAISIDDESLRVLQRAGLADDVYPILQPGTGTRYYGADGRLLVHAKGRRPYLLGVAFNCGKGQPGQVAPVSHGCPSARFRQVNVVNTRGEAGRGAPPPGCWGRATRWRSRPWPSPAATSGTGW